METLLPGISAERVRTSRLTMAVLSVTGRTGQPVLFVHGNVSSSLFWQPTMLALPEGYRPLAVDLRGFGETDPEPVDATRGLGDYADDLAAVIEARGLAPVHLVGWSMGGGVVLQYLSSRPAAHHAASVTLVVPVSPFGFGGTRGAEGTLCDPSGVGSGAGPLIPTSSRAWPAAIRAPTAPPRRDRTLEERHSARFSWGRCSSSSWNKAESTDRTKTMITSRGSRRSNGFALGGACESSGLATTPRGSSLAVTR